jgi:flavin reductase (DIM6/NTAB) family NADH-FMN oxidoreductase RutF
MQDKIAELCRQLSLGAYVIGVADHRSHEAFTACSVMQASCNPVLLAASVDPQHASYALIRTARSFSVNVLRKDHPAIARGFGTTSGHVVDRFRNVSWSRGETGAPLLDDAMAWFECELTAVMPAGDHQILLGRVMGGHVAEADAGTMRCPEAENLDGGRRLYQESYF